jgi:16S rRNA (cytosine1402-N4)-methyltransferase
VARQNLEPLKLKLDLVHGSFKDIRQVLNDCKVKSVDGILLDLGISSFQLNDPARGFAFKTQGPLDMRMDKSTGQSAAELIHRADQETIANIIFEFGEERFSRRIAQAIVEERSKNKITETQQLANIILRSLPKGYQRGRIHPATRTFQALRIAVNSELDILPDALKTCFECLALGGRLVVIAFHSLEDRIVKNTFKAIAGEERGLLLVKKPLEPSKEECISNPRARSAKLRVIQRTS